MWAPSRLQFGFPRMTRHARLAELRYFGGFSIEEAAAALGISPATAKRDWTLARAWLYRRIRRGGTPRG